MDEAEIREAAYHRWENKGRPEGEHERHWREAEDEGRKSTGAPRTMASHHNAGAAPSTASEGAGVAQPKEPSNDWMAAEKG